MSRYNDHTTRNLLGYSSYQNHHKRIGIDLSRQANTSFPNNLISQ